jgi:hypothetical protein
VVPFEAELKGLGPTSLHRVPRQTPTAR